MERALAAAAALSGVIIRRAPQSAGAKGRLPGGLSVDLVWVADSEMRELSRRFAGRRGTTDVLAFENSGPGPDTGRHLGEIVCNLELAGREAAARGHTREAEVVLYATHGLVHLLGGRDGTPGDRRRMRRVELGALRAAGIEVRGGEWESAELFGDGDGRRKTRRGG